MDSWDDGARLTQPQLEEWRDRFQEQMASQDRHRLMVLPPVSSLTPDEMRDLLRECVTVVAPGETLIVRISPDCTPAQVQEYQQRATEIAEHQGLGFKILVLPAEDLAVARGE